MPYQYNDMKNSIFDTNFCNIVNSNGSISVADAVIFLHSIKYIRFPQTSHNSDFSKKISIYNDFNLN